MMQRELALGDDSLIQSVDMSTAKKLMWLKPKKPELKCNENLSCMRVKRI